MNKEFLKQCWKNPRWHSLMVLIIWIISLTILIGIVSIINQFGSPKEPIKNETKESKTTYEDKWNNLLNDNYEFTYLVKMENETIKYEGTKKDNVTFGYRERKDGIIKYTIENDIAYEVLIEEKCEINTLYENVEENLLNLTYLNDLIKSISANDSDILEEDNKTIYEYNTILNEENLKIIVIEDQTQIKKITIQKEKETYEFEFARINK